MSDTLNIFDFTKMSDRQLIQSIIAESFMVDYGIVQAVNDNKTVDVEHAVRAVTMAGIVAPSKVLDPTITRGVELLFPVMSGISIAGTVAKGDGVLLVGLRGLVPTTEGLDRSSAPPEFWHYSQQTLKAIPLSAMKATSVQFGEQGGKAFLRNASQSLYTLVDSLEAALQTFMGSTSQAAIAAGGTSPASLAAALVQLMIDFTAATATMRTDLAQLLEE